MSKRRPVVLDYNGLRILLDTVAGYCSIYTADSSRSPAQYGIRFYLRTGEIIEHTGSDEISRGKVLKFLDDYFKPTHFSGNKCQVCVYKADQKNNKCFSERNCSDYSGLLGFAREG